jgi:MerR family mercuric resistance operon transcriptional regulator
MDSLTIGKVAREAGVNVETVRYYERRGLVERPSSRQGAYRVYPPETVGRIRSIKRAQRLGFSLDEIKELLAMRVNAEARCGDVLAQAERKMVEIDEKIESLQAVKLSLGRLTEACRMERPVTECPILEAFTKDAEDG